MSELTPCSSCAELVLGDPRSCPHCGEVRRRGVPAAAVVLGLTLSVGGTGCWEGQALYGAAYTPTDSADTADTGDTTVSSAKGER